MDRSSTPRASQQQQRQQGSSSSSSNNNTHYGNIGIGQRRGKNRSRSGSEELSQIIAEAQRAKNEQKMHSNGFWPISNGFSRPTSVTPTPYNLNGDVHENGNAEEEQSRTTSPGLLSWVRNAIMLGPSGRAAIPFDENNDTISQRNRFSPTDPIKRNQTPLLPGTIPSFHHIDRQKTLEPPLMIQERPRSERSSISFDGGSSVGHDSLESYDFAASIRRSSTVSSVSTASSAIASSHRRSATDATVNDTEDDDSDQEDVYAPFAQRQHGPSLIRPTARREALGFGPPSPPTSVPQNEFQNRTSSTALGHGYGITGSEHNLNISEGE
ncbi:hypothetical protein L7F22_019678 [Adiantum nelumboides]|nr:hypothetical protein [Adiantum nelumboides]